MSQPSPAFTRLPPSGTPTFVSADAALEFEQVIRDRIGDRAFHIFEESGRIDGRDIENWQQAELEILRNGLSVRDTGQWLSVSGELCCLAPQNVQILVQPRRVLVHAESPDQTFFAADLAAEVDPQTAIASTRAGSLKLMVRKRG
jgi:DUF2934 family protein